MTGPIPINPVNVRPELQGGQIPPVQYPDLAGTFLEAMLSSQREKGLNSRNSIDAQIRRDELALQREHFKFLQSQEETKQRAIEHQQTIADAQGKATLEFIKNIAPHAVQTGQAQQLMD